jgi:anti-anti-sigma factor
MVDGFSAAGDRYFEVYVLQGGVRGLRLVGELDMGSVPLLVEAFSAGTGQAVLDVSELSFIDSSGIHALVDLAAQENGNGPLILQGALPHIIRLFELMKIGQNANLEIRSGSDGR